MKKLLLTLTLLLSTIVSAEEIKCYNYGHVVYHHNVKDISYSDNVMVFVEKKSGKVFVTDLDCMIKMN